MAVSAKYFGPGWLKQVIEAAWAADTIKWTLHSSSLTPAQDTMDFFDDVSATELATAGGYTAGGATAGTKATSYTAGSNTIAVDAADTSWTGSGAGFTAAYAVGRKDTGSAATSPLVGWVDFGGDQIIAAGDILTLQWDPTTGIASVVIS